MGTPNSSGVSRRATSVLTTNGNSLDTACVTARKRERRICQPNDVYTRVKRRGEGAKRRSRADFFMFVKKFG